MFSQDDDSQQRVALMLVFAIVAIVVAGVLTFGARMGMSPRAAAPAGGTMQAPVAAASAALASSAPVEAPAQNAAQAASDAASVKVEQGVVKFYFASGKADLAAGAGEALADVVKSAAAGRKLVISGFHDASGDAAKNAALARQRAVAVRDALKAAGVTDQQIDLKKPEQLEGTGSDAEARRVEITVE